MRVFLNNLALKVILWYIYTIFFIRGVKMKKFISVLLSTIIIVSSLAVGFTAFADAYLLSVYGAGRFCFGSPFAERVTCSFSLCFIAKRTLLRLCAGGFRPLVLTFTAGNEKSY